MELPIQTKAPSTPIRFQTKTELFCSGYGYRPQYNEKNDHRKRSHSKTLSWGPVQTKTELFCSVFKKICVHTYRFRIVFARPHYNAISVWKRCYTLCARSISNSLRRLSIFTAKNTAKSKRAVRQEHQLSCASCTWAMDFARDANVTIKVTERKISDSFSSRRRRTRTHALTTLPPPLRRRISKGITYLFRSCVARS